MAKNTSIPSKVDGVTGNLNGIFSVTPGALNIEKGYNVRDFNPTVRDADRELLNSIGVIGVQTPLVLRLENGKLYIMQGHRRYAAVLHYNATTDAKIKTIPAQLYRGDATSPASRTLDILTSNSGVALSMLERGVIFLRLKAFGWTDDDMAAKAGVSVKTVSECVRLAKADPAMLKFVRGYVSPKGVIVNPPETVVLSVIRTAGTDAPAVMDKAAEIAPVKDGKARINAPVIEQAKKEIEKETGKPVVGASGKPSLDAKTLAAKAKVDTKAKAEAAKADPSLSNPKPNKHVSFPVRLGADAYILDNTGDGVAHASDLETGKLLVQYINQGWTADQAARAAKLAAQPVPGRGRGRPPKAKQDGKGKAA